MPASAAHSRTAWCSTVSKTGWSSGDERPMIWGTSLVAVRCSIASARSFVSRSTRASESLRSDWGTAARSTRAPRLSQADGLRDHTGAPAPWIGVRRPRSSEQGLQLAANGEADPLDVLLPRVEDAHPQPVERGDDEPHVDVGRR